MRRSLSRKGTSSGERAHFASLSDHERAALLDEALEPYLAKGWKLDDRFGSTAMISQEFGARYMFSALSTALMGAGSGRGFKRRQVRVDEHGNISIKRAPSRLEGESRYKDRGT